MQNLNRIALTGLRAVEATHRLGSLGAAAGELRVTTGAVSQQVARTEATLGVTLFERHPGGMRPTPRGRRSARFSPRASPSSTLPWRWPIRPARGG